LVYSETSLTETNDLLLSCLMSTETSQFQSQIMRHVTPTFAPYANLHEIDHIHRARKLPCSL
jgi:hypothetical protein